MKNPTKTAIVIATGKKVEVYRHALSDAWINCDDCTTMYKTEELKFN